MAAELLGIDRIRTKDLAAQDGDLGDRRKGNRLMFGTRYFPT